MKKLTITQVSELTDSSVITSVDTIVEGVCSTEESKENFITFYNGKSKSALEKVLENLKASAIIVSKEINLDNIKSNNISILHSQEPQKAFLVLVNFFHPQILPNFEIHPKSEIDHSTKLGDNCKIGPFTYIGRSCLIGENTVVHPNVTIYDNVKIGKNCVIHSGASIRENVNIGDNIVIQNGAVIGADGFGYIPGPAGLITVPQVGNVKLENNVDIGANTCIDRAALGSTKVGIGTKIDNLVQIGHNTHIGMHSIVCGQSAIAGSSKIGNQVVLGGNVGVADHTEITDGCRFAAFSGLHGKYSEKGDYGGNPALPAKLYRKVVGILPRLPELAKSLKESENN